MLSCLDNVPWTLSEPTVQFDLTKLKKDMTNPETYKQFYLKLITEYASSEKINTCILSLLKKNLSIYISILACTHFLHLL